MYTNKKEFILDQESKTYNIWDLMEQIWTNIKINLNGENILKNYI